MNNRKEGAKSALLSALMYYEIALRQEGCIDTKKEIAETVAKGIDLTLEQRAFLEMKRKSSTEKMDSVIVLLKHMNSTGRVDTKVMVKIIEYLDSLRGEVGEK